MSTEMKDMTIWLYGAPYSGKTVFASNFPNAAVLSFDGNAQHASNDAGEPLFKNEQIFNIKSLDEMQTALKKINASDKFETLIVDTIDILEQMVRQHVLDQLEIEDESQGEGYGLAWRYSREGFYKALFNMKKFKGNVIFVSWEDEYVETDKLGREFTKYRPLVNPKLHARISGLTTIIMRTIKKQTKDGFAYGLSIGGDANELGGTRMTIKKNTIPNDYQKFVENFVN